MASRVASRLQCNSAALLLLLLDSQVSAPRGLLLHHTPQVLTMRMLCSTPLAVCVCGPVGRLVMSSVSPDLRTPLPLAAPVSDQAEGTSSSSSRSQGAAGVSSHQADATLADAGAASKMALHSHELAPPGAAAAAQGASSSSSSAPGASNGLDVYQVMRKAAQARAMVATARAHE